MKVFITGTGGGIGEAIARKFLAQGHDVIGMDICSSSICHEEYPGSYSHIICDITEKKLPDIDGIEILINNAGVQDSGADIDINLKGTMNVTEKYGLEPSVKSILFIASSSASNGAEFPEYAASKGGIVAYMKNVALRAAKHGATVNSLSPGGVMTELNRHVMDDPKLWQAVLDETMLSKWASAEEVAQWAYFLTVINKSMTAQDILVDNGEQAKACFVW